jgi:hypothetical protein
VHFYAIFDTAKHVHRDSWPITVHRHHGVMAWRTQSWRASWSKGVEKGGALYASAQKNCPEPPSMTRWRYFIVRFITCQFLAQGNKMLGTIAVVLVILWLLGFVTSYTMGGFIHILLVIAVVMILVRLIQGQRL